MSTCFYLGGNQASGDVPCNDGAKYPTCCASPGLCTTGGLCLAGHSLYDPGNEIQYAFGRGTCTNLTSPNCLHICRDVKNGGVGVWACNDDLTSFCCDTSFGSDTRNRSCCNDGSSTFNIPTPLNLTNQRSLVFSQTDSIVSSSSSSSVSASSTSASSTTSSSASSSSASSSSTSSSSSFYSSPSLSVSSGLSFSTGTWLVSSTSSLATITPSVSSSPRLEKSNEIIAVGLGVGVPLAVIILAMLACFLRQKYRSRHNRPSHQGTKPQVSPVYGISAPVPSPLAITERITPAPSGGSGPGPGSGSGQPHVQHFELDNSFGVGEAFPALCELGRSPVIR